MAILLMIMLSLSAAVSARAATASWTEVAEPDIQGYRLYVAAGTCAYPGPFVLLQTYGMVSSGEVPTPDLAGTYCYKLTAFTQDAESDFSNAAEYTFMPPPNTCPSVSYCNTLKGRAKKQCLACTP